MGRAGPVLTLPVLRHTRLSCASWHLSLALMLRCACSCDGPAGQEPGLRVGQPGHQGQQRQALVRAVPALRAVPVESGAQVAAADQTRAVQVHGRCLKEQSVEHCNAASLSGLMHQAPWHCTHAHACASSGRLGHSICRGAAAATAATASRRVRAACAGHAARRSTWWATPSCWARCSTGRPCAAWPSRTKFRVRARLLTRSVFPTGPAPA